MSEGECVNVSVCVSVCEGLTLSECMCVHVRVCNVRVCKCERECLNVTVREREGLNECMYECVSV